MSLDVVKNLNTVRGIDQNITPYLRYSLSDEKDLTPTERIQKELKDRGVDAKRANRMGNIFSDEASVEHLCREKPSIAKRIWERIKAVLDSIGKTSAEREEIKKLRETERLFRKALETGG